MKTSKVLFNMDTTLKKELMEKTKKEGWTLSALLNFMGREYLAGNIKMDAIQRGIEAGRDDFRNGRYRTLEEVKKRLGL
ncbi:MAG: hypothetical protein V4524_01105 [Patescibacteria group bacterium]